MYLKVGCCGFPVSHDKYYRQFSVVELQNTFYQLPQAKTAIRWRDEAPPNFEFTIKAWQAITHPASSPTWRKMKTAGDLVSKNFGLLRPTKENFEAWNATLEICKLVGSKVCVIQCLPQFEFTVENVRNMKKFFRHMDRKGLILALEPRGNWHDKPKEIKQLCREWELVHCVDLLREDPADINSTGYFRLHSLGPRELNYSYRYAKRDLSLLAKKLSSLARSGMKEAYVMFNNISMLNDAKKFLETYG